MPLWILLVLWLARVVVSRQEPPPNCLWTRLDSERDKFGLGCHLRTLSGDFQDYNFSQFQVEHTWKLNIRCSDVFFFESSLGNQSFSRLVNLRELSVDFCKIRSVPWGSLNGLSQLKRLSLRTHNSDWSAMTMELESECFTGLKELQWMDLSRNNIFTLPAGLLCPLPNLVTLNLSHNHLQDVRDLGFHSCDTQLLRLDLSRNELGQFPDDSLLQMRKLQELYVQKNDLRSVGDLSLSGLVSLRLLNMSSNQLVALPPELFLSSRDLREIYLQNNSISVLAPGLFEEMDQLMVLDLSSNALTSTWVHKETFKGLIRLVILNLAYNSLTKLDANTFRDLYSLQVLNLDHNQISSVGDGTFLPLSNLHILSLTYNNLLHVDAFLFDGLYVLNQLFLDHNQIESIHERAFRNCSNLQDLSLSGNRLAEVPAAVSNLQFLQTLDLGENAVSVMSEGSLQGLPQLTGLRLVSNRLESLERGALGSLPGLQVLNLAQNGLRRIEAGALDTCPHLQALRLDSNALEEVSLHALSHLLWLNLSANNLASFDYSFLPHSLEWLDLRHNHISHLGNYFDLQDRLRIKMLDVGFNQLAEIDELSLPNSVESVFLANNRLTSIKPNTFLKKTNLSRVVLLANELETLDLNALRLHPMGKDKKVPEFYIGGNPFYCDCRMEWLQRINHLSHLRQHPRVMDLDSIMCRLAHSRQGSHRPLLETSVSQFLCTYDSHCFALCHCCDFDACDCEMTCPTNCTCYHDGTWTANIVDCSSLSYLEVPQRLPMDATELYLDGNKIGEMGSHIFIGKKNLRVLYLNNSQVETIGNRTFNGLNSLTVLHLEENRLEALRGFEFDQLKKLKELFLSDNRITFVANGTFQNLHALEILRLDGNFLVEMSVWQFASNPYLTSITLSRNKWSCHCSFLNSFKIWVTENHNKVTDSDFVRCDANDTKGMTQYLGNVSTSCDNYVATFVTQDMASHNYVPVLVITLGIFVATFLVSVLVFVFRHDVKVWAYSQYGLRLCGQTPKKEDGDKLFDAYIIYSVKDEDFATQVLAAELENGESASRLCLHYRDFPVTSYLADTIVGAMDSCRRIIIVLSKNFLQCEWTNLDFRSAIHTALHQQKRIVIFLLLDSVQDFEIDAEVKLYLKNCTTLVWREKRFWEKLRYSLPDSTVKRGQHFPHHHHHHHHHGLPLPPFPVTPAQLNSLHKEPNYQNGWSYHLHHHPLNDHCPSSATPSTQSSYISGGSAKREEAPEATPGANFPIQYPSTNCLHHTYMTLDGRGSVARDYSSSYHQHQPSPKEDHHSHLPPPAEVHLRTHFV